MLLWFVYRCYDLSSMRISLSRLLTCMFDNGISLAENGFFLTIIIGCVRGVKLLVWPQYTIFDIICVEVECEVPCFCVSLVLSYCWSAV